MTKHQSRLEESFATQVRLAGLPEPAREYRFADGRRFRFDFAWPSERVAVEIDGGTWVQGRHARGAGIESDCLKYSLAAVYGWRVLRFTGAMVNNGTAIALIQRAIQGDGTTTTAGRKINRFSFADMWSVIEITCDTPSGPKRAQKTRKRPRQPKSDRVGLHQPGGDR